MNIIVIGVVHHNTLGMVRCLGMSGYNVDLILISHNGYVSKSKYVKRTIVVENESEIISILLNNYRNVDAKSIVMSCSDTISSALDLNYRKLKDNFYFFHCGEEGKVTYYMNKQIQVDIAKSVGLMTPSSYEYAGEILKISFPCLLKPVKSINGGKKVLICNNGEELKQGLANFSKTEKVQIQQFLQKEAEIVVLGCATDHEVTIPGYILKHRDFDGGTLFSTVCPIQELPNDFIEKCKAMVKNMKYKGLFGIEFIKSGGQYYFIEINLRNDATTYALAVAGANLPEYYIDSLVGINKRKPSVAARIKAIVEFNDYKHRREYGISAFSWLRQYLNSKCKYYWSSRDPVPFFFAPFK